MTAVSAGWPQAAGPPPAPAPEQATPQQATPQLAGAAKWARGRHPPPENPGLIDEMGKVLEKSLSILPTLKSPSETFDDLNARAKDAAKDAGESLSRLAKPASMVTGRTDMSGFGQRRSGLQDSGRQALPVQGLQGGQEPHDRFGGGLFGQGADPGPYPEAGRLPDRQFRHPRAVPIVPFVIRRNKHDCLLEMMSGIFQADVASPHRCPK